MFKVNPGEQINNIIRKHWFIIFRETFGLLLLFFIPLVLYIWFANTEINLGPNMSFSIGSGTDTMLLAGSIWGLFIWMKIFASWTDHYLDVWVITDKRIVDIEQKGFFHREVSSFRLDKIQDVTIKTSGFVDTMIDMGDIHVQTAGESKTFILKGIPKPEEAKLIVLSAHDKALEQTKRDTI